MSISLQTCPCQVNPASQSLRSPLLYKDCCQPYHDSLVSEEADKVDDVKPKTAERLMRTRYSAFVLIKPEYIVKTTLPTQQKLLDIKVIESWAKETDWAGLEIVQHTPKLGKRHAQVEFKAYFKTPEGLQAHHELSAFVKTKTKLIMMRVGIFWIRPLLCPSHRNSRVFVGLVKNLRGVVGCT